MSTHRPVGGSVVTPFTAILAVLVLIGFYFLGQRFIYGLGAVANINDGFPWGIWVVYDVVIGTGLACGGYAMAILVYIFNKGEYHPLVRPALLASAFGYSLGGFSVLFDLGRYWNMWHIFVPGYAHVNSVMFEVALCVAAYIVVLWIEFTPVFLEKLGMKDAKKSLNKLLYLFIALGILLPTMHQSSLGSLLVVFGTQIHPLWQTPLLPLLFLMSAITMGYCVVVFEATLSSAGFKRPSESHIIAPLSKVVSWFLIAYLVIRFGDLAMRGALGLAFTSGFKSFMFWLENILYAIPIVMLAGQGAKNPRCLFIASVSMLLAAFFYRINAFLVGYDTGPGWTYFPSVPEIMVTIGIIALEVLAYIVFVKKLPVLHGAR